MRKYDKRAKRINASEMASELAKARWKKTPENMRAEVVGHNGGRRKIYKPCPLGTIATGFRHRFRQTGFCRCGQKQLTQ